jgi:DNA-binding PadR family transcriptional regulator
LQDVETLSSGKIKLSNGTLYGALIRLQEQGLIERVPSREPAVSGKPRKDYRLTETGARILQAEVDRLSTLLNAARARLPEGT